MIQSQTYVNVTDNTGAKQLMCIRVLGNNRKVASIGDIIIGVVKNALPNMIIKRSEIVRAIIVRTKKTILRNDGMAIRFDDNAAVIITTDNNPKGTRIFGPIAKEIRSKKFPKLLAICNEII